MSLVKYAVTKHSDNTVSFSGYYDDSAASLSTFKTEYEAAHSGYTVVDTSVSPFPDGMGWFIGSDGNTYPHNTNEGTFSYIDGQNISDKTEYIKYNGTFTCSGMQFSQDRNVISELGMLLSLKNDIPEGCYPVKIRATVPAGSTISLARASDISSFLNSLLVSQVNATTSDANEVTKINGYTTIDQLVLCVDPR